MAREIADTVVMGDFPPMVGMRTKGNFVKGKVLALGTTTNGNPVISLALIDLDGSTSISKSKGVYEEVAVKVGDTVQVIGSNKQLREKLPQLKVGDIATVTFKGKKALKQGRTLNEYRVEVDE
jgi:hypothetical protein